jgi:hypothetical protein
LTGIPAIIFGVLGLSDIKDPRKRVTGKGMAITGIATGGLTSFVGLLAILFFVLAPIIEAARGPDPRGICGHNLHEIAQAMHDYEAANNCLPPAATFDAHGKPLLSWRVLILPYFGGEYQKELYQQFRLDEPWDSPHNLPLVNQMPRQYKCPTAAAPDGWTTYQVVRGPRTLFTGGQSGIRRFASATDPYTILVVEAVDPVPWTIPADIPSDSSEPRMGIGAKHDGRFFAAFADDVVRPISDSIAQDTLRAMVTRDGHEPVEIPDF